MLKNLKKYTAQGQRKSQSITSKIVEFVALDDPSNSIDFIYLFTSSDLHKGSQLFSWVPQSRQLPVSSRWCCNDDSIVKSLTRSFHCFNNGWNKKLGWKTVFLFDCIAKVSDRYSFWQILRVKWLGLGLRAKNSDWDILSVCVCYCPVWYWCLSLTRVFHLLETVFAPGIWHCKSSFLDITLFKDSKWKAQHCLLYLLISWSHSLAPRYLLTANGQPRR